MAESSPSTTRWRSSTAANAVDRPDLRVETERLAPVGEADQLFAVGGDDHLSDPGDPLGCRPARSMSSVSASGSKGSTPTRSTPLLDDAEPIVEDRPVQLVGDDLPGLEIDEVGRRLLQRHQADAGSHLAEDVVGAVFDARCPTRHRRTRRRAGRGDRHRHRRRRRADRARFGQGTKLMVTVAVVGDRRRPTDRAVAASSAGDGERSGRLLRCSLRRDVHQILGRPGVLDPLELGRPLLGEIADRDGRRRFSRAAVASAASAAAGDDGQHRASHPPAHGTPLSACPV